MKERTNDSCTIKNDLYNTQQYIAGNFALTLCCRSLLRYSSYIHPIQWSKLLSWENVRMTKSYGYLLNKILDTDIQYNTYDTLSSQFRGYGAGKPAANDKLS